MAGQSQDSTALLADQLAEGFAALSGEYQALFDQHRQLETKLSWAKQQYLDLLKRLTPSTLPQDHRVFLSDLEGVGAENAAPQTDWIDNLGQGDSAEHNDHVAAIRRAAEAVTKLPPSQPPGVKIWNGPSADKKRPSPLRFTSSQTHIPHLEKDFTTSGVPSKLGCPFAGRSGPQSALTTPRSSISRISLPGRRSQRPSFNDPIRAEICGNDPSSASVSIEGSPAVCPIRFLDQHAPEEVAKYFENHKHDLPRSHEVCIKRFQSNAESIEQLDRKYGNLVSMIQGLGQKHQEYLPLDPEDADEEMEAEREADAKTEAKVEKWANAVTASLHDGTPEESLSPGKDAQEERSPRFDRPMKEIRVGESPSRPWGVSIPAKYTDANSSSSVGSAPTASPQLPLEEVNHKPVEQTPQKPSKCPFNHAALGKTPEMKRPDYQDEDTVKKPRPQPQMDGGLQASALSSSEHEARPGPRFTRHPEPEAASAPRAESAPPGNGRHKEHDGGARTVPQIVFNGPVFLGYPPDQLLTLLQNSNFGAEAR